MSAKAVIVAGRRRLYRAKREGRNGFRFADQDQGRSAELAPGASAA